MDSSGSVRRPGRSGGLLGRVRTFLWGPEDQVVQEPRPPRIVSGKNDSTLPEYPPDDYETERLRPGTIPGAVSGRASPYLRADSPAISSRFDRRLGTPGPAVGRSNSTMRASQSVASLHSLSSRYLDDVDDPNSILYDLFRQKKGEGLTKTEETLALRLIAAASARDESVVDFSNLSAFSGNITLADAPNPFETGNSSRYGNGYANSSRGDFGAYSTFSSPRRVARSPEKRRRQLAAGPKADSQSGFPLHRPPVKSVSMPRIRNALVAGDGASETPSRQLSKTATELQQLLDKPEEEQEEGEQRANEVQWDTNGVHPSYDSTVDVPNKRLRQSTKRWRTDQKSKLGQQSSLGISSSQSIASFPSLEQAEPQRAKEEQKVKGKPQPNIVPPSASTSSPAPKFSIPSSSSMQFSAPAHAHDKFKPAKSSLLASSSTSSTASEQHGSRTTFNFGAAPGNGLLGADAASQGIKSRNAGGTFGLFDADSTPKDLEEPKTKSNSKPQERPAVPSLLFSNLDSDRKVAPFKAAASLFDQSAPASAPVTVTAASDFDTSMDQDFGQAPPGEPPVLSAEVRAKVDESKQQFHF